jgi:hypothetical protein
MTRSVSRAARVGAALVMIVLAVAGCAADKNAVAQGSQYVFVSPGGKAEIFYDLAQRQVANQMAAFGAGFLGIGVRDGRQAALDFLHDYQITYPSILDRLGRSLW